MRRRNLFVLVCSLAVMVGHAQNIKQVLATGNTPTGGFTMLEMAADGSVLAGGGFGPVMASSPGTQQVLVTGVDSNGNFHILQMNTDGSLKVSGGAGTGTVTTSGTMTSGDCVKSLGGTVIADAGAACGSGGGSGFPITLGSTSIASGSTNTSLTGLTVDGVSPTTFGFLDPTSSVQTQLNGKQASLGFTAVANTVTVNGHPLSANVTVTNADLGAVPTTRTINTHALSADVVLGFTDFAGAISHAQLPTLLSGDIPNNAANTSGTAGNVSGTPALPNGTTATTQTLGDATGKLANDAFVAAALAAYTPPAQVYPGAGVAVSTGLAWAASLTAPTGALVGTTDTQSLSNKTLDGVTPATMAFVDPTSSIQTQLNGKQASLGFTAVPNTRTVNTHALSADIVLAFTDFAGAISHAQLPTLLSGDIPNNASNTTGTSGGLTGTPNISVATLAASGTVTFPNIASTSGNFCVQVSATGLLSNTGLACGSGGGGIPYPGAGIALSSGSAWLTSLTAPTGAIVGTTDTQTLTNKTVDGVTPTTFGFVDPTSSIQTQFNSKFTSAVITPAAGGPLTLDYAGKYAGLQRIGRMFVYGDSFSRGLGVTFYSQSYAGLLQRDVPATIYNNSVGSTETQQYGTQIINSFDPDPNATNVSLISGEENNPACAGVNACVQHYQEAQSFNLAWLTIPFSNRMMASACTHTSGSWTFFGAAAVILPTLTMQQSPGTNQEPFAGTPVLTCTVTTTTATTKIGISFIVVTGNTGTFTATIDGSSITDACSASTTFTSAPCSAFANGQTQGMYRQEYTVSPATSHTVVFTATGSPIINSVDFAVPNAANNNIAFQYATNAAWANFTALNTALQGMISTFQADGLAVNYVDVVNGITVGGQTYAANGTTDVSTTPTGTCSGSTLTKHPNTCGHEHYRETLQAAEYTAIGPTGSTGFVFSSPNIDSNTNIGDGNQFFGPIVGKESGGVFPAASTMAAQFSVMHISGTTPITTMTPPPICLQEYNDCYLTLIFDTSGGTVSSGTNAYQFTQGYVAPAAASAVTFVYGFNQRWLIIGSNTGFPLTLGSTALAAGSTTTSVAGLTVDGVTPTTFGFVDPTSSIQTQLNGKQASLGFTAVANTVTVNTHALSSNVVVSATDITTGTLPHAQLPTLLSGDIPNNAANTSGSAGSLSAALALSGLATQATDTVVMNATGGTAVPTAVALLSCSTASSALTYNTTTHVWGCNSITTTQVYPGAGIAVSNGTAWLTSLTAPTGAIVGTTDTQTLTNKSIASTEITGLPTFPTGTILGTTDTQTTTNKTVDGVTPATFAFVDPTSSIQTQLNAKAALASPTFTGAPSLAAATATSLLASGNVDGTAPVTITTGTTATLGGTFRSGYTFNQEATAAAAVTYTLPTAAAGRQYCVANSFNGTAPTTGTLEILTSASGQFIIYTDGTLSATGGFVQSSGAALDSACVVGVDATHWQLSVQRGSWTKH